MVDILRPEYGQAWASEGEKVQPTSDKTKSGWVQEMMPFQWENFLQARQDNTLLYLLQKGVPEYSPTQEYTANKSFVQYNGVLYCATQTVIGVLPTVVASWKRISGVMDGNGVVSIAGGGTGSTTASGARTNLGLGTFAVTDTPSANGSLTKTPEGIVSRLLSGVSGNIVITNPDGVSGNPTVDVGSNVVRMNADASWTTTGSIKLPSGSTADRGLAVAGRIRFNTETKKFEGYDGTNWGVVGAVSEVSITILSGDGVTTSFTLSEVITNPNTAWVHVGGVYQNKGTYTISGSIITFSEAPTVGVENIEVLGLRVVDIGATTASQVSIADTGNYYAAVTVEQALSEVATTKASVADVSQAIATAATFTTTPTTFKAWSILVTTPHLRAMVWNGTKYIRAPWHQPGTYFYAHDPLGKITHGIQVRTDVTYNKADHPDLAEYLGITTETFVLPGDGRARVLRGTDLGAGVDTALINGYMQGDAGRNLSGSFGYIPNPGASVVDGAFSSTTSASQNILGTAAGTTRIYDFNASRQWVGATATEFRVKSLAACLYITR